MSGGGFPTERTPARTSSEARGGRSPELLPHRNEAARQRLAEERLHRPSRRVQVALAAMEQPDLPLHLTLPHLHRLEAPAGALTGHDEGKSAMPSPRSTIRRIASGLSVSSTMFSASPEASPAASSARVTTTLGMITSVNRSTSFSATGFFASASGWPAGPHGDSEFRIEAGEAKILIDPFLSDNRSRDNGWSGCLTGKNSTRGGDR